MSYVISFQPLSIETPGHESALRRDFVTLTKRPSLSSLVARGRELAGLAVAPSHLSFCEGVHGRKAQ